MLLIHRDHVIAAEIAKTDYLVNAVLLAAGFADEKTMKAKLKTIEEMRKGVVEVLRADYFDTQKQRAKEEEKKLAEKKDRDVLSKVARMG